MALKLLHKGSEDERRWKIIEASKNADDNYLPQLHARLLSDECLENKRHIIRALGKIRSSSSIPYLLEMLTQSKGLILGDLCQTLSKLEAKEATEQIEKLLDHKESWVQQEAKSAFKKLST